MSNANISKWYDLKLGDMERLDDYNDLIRVPGGWVLHSFSHDNGEYKKTSVFIPYSEEFLNGASGNP